MRKENVKACQWEERESVVLAKHRLHKERATTWRAAREWNRVESHCLPDPGRNESLSEHGERNRNDISSSSFRACQCLPLLYMNKVVNYANHESMKKPELGTWGGNYKRSRGKSSRKEDIGLCWDREREREDIRMNQSLNHFLRYRANFVETLICYIMERLSRYYFCFEKR